MNTIIANKDKANIVVSVIDAPADKVIASEAVPAKAKKRGRPSKSVEAGSAKSSVAPKKRGRPRKQPV